MTQLNTQQKSELISGLYDELAPRSYPNNNSASNAALAPFMRACTTLALARKMFAKGNHDALVDAAYQHLGSATDALRISEPSLSPPPIDPASKAYKVIDASDLQQIDAEKKWLVDKLWMAGGTGIIGGPPKAAKTWLALDMALSVASNTRCLNEFSVFPGSVLYVSAEGGQGYVRQRLDNMCEGRGLDLTTLPHPLRFISDQVRIDTAEGMALLEATIRSFSPSLLVLDPLVRLHRLDENSASSVSRMLSDLTALQLRYGTAIIAVHHTTKNGAHLEDVGSHLRGSGDFYAWGDSNVLLTKKNGQFKLRAEHRAAPAPESWTLKFADEGPAHLVITDAHEPPEENKSGSSDQMRKDILATLESGRKKLVEIRKLVPGRHDKKTEVLMLLANEGLVTRDGIYWALSLAAQ